MNTKIGRRIYDTDKARLIARKVSGCYGDAAGFEELLYQKPQGEFFIHGTGGSASPYPETEIVPMSIAQTRDWLRDVVGTESAEEICALAEIKTEPVRKREAAKAGR